MQSKGRVWPTTMIVLGAVGVVMGAVFIFQGVTKGHMLRDAMRTEKVALYFVPGADKHEVIDTAKEAMAAGDTIREHRRKIAPTYGDLLGGKKFDPSKPEQLTYAQALNMENYLYLAVVGFGLTQMAVASGVFMIIMGIGLGGTGIALYKLSNFNR